jgi:hypothetical protein
MFEQPSLFDSLTAELVPGVRATDPPTSVIAFDSVRAELPRQRALVLLAVVEHQNVLFGVTAADLASILERQQSVMSKRLGELVAAGLCDEAGTRRGPSGRLLTVYFVSPAGLKLASMMEEA